jgi:PRTRC genetic system protein A
MLNAKDTLLMSQFPTLMVPRFEPLSPCETHKTRLLMANDGLYIETVQPWGRIVSNLWQSHPRTLPYGKVQEYDSFAAIFARPDVRQILSGVVREEAARYADSDLEWASWVIWSREGGFRYQELSLQETTVSRVRLDRYQLADGEHLVVDIHSHGRLPPFFSPIDDKDDAGGVKISVVLGSYDAECRRFAYRVRYCVEGFFLDGPATTAGGDDE